MQQFVNQGSGALIILKPQTLAQQSSEPVSPAHGLWWSTGYRFKRNRMAVAAAIVLLAVILLVLLIPLFSSFTYDAIDWEHYWLQPDFASGHYLGTDLLGRDLLVRTAMGGRLSLLVGIGSTLIAILVGMLYGIIAGYLGGWIDKVMMFWLDFLDTVPFIFLVILLVTYCGNSLLWVFVAISTLSWLNIARIVRVQTLNLKQKGFVLAAQLCGVKPFNIMLRHIVPNVLGLVVVHSSLLIPAIILFEASVSFLGLGTQEPMTSWGSLMQLGASTMEVSPWALLCPGSFLVLTLFCCNFISDALQHALDPQAA